MVNTISGDLGSVISKVSEKATSAETASSQELQLDSKIKNAEQRADSASKQLDQASVSKQEAQDKLSPPPMKTEPGEGKKGNSKKVVDENEKNKLEANVRAADAQIQQAQKAVDLAKSEASDFKTQKANMGSLSADQQRDMTTLTNELTELKRLAKDPSTNVDSPEFQQRVKSAADTTKRLADTLPNSGATKDFWNSTKAAFKEINAGVEEYYDIDAPEINSANNYQSFFDQANTEFGKTLTNLSGNIDQSLTQQLSNARDSVLNERGTYLEGITDDDKGSMGELLRQLLVINDKSDRGEAVTSEDIAGLLTASQETSQILDKGGSASEAAIGAPFEGIDMNFREIDSRDSDATLDAFGQKLKLFYDAPENNISDLRGISNNDMQVLFDYSEMVRNSKNQVLGGQALSNDQRTNLINKGNEFMQLLISHYSLTDGATPSSNPTQFYANNGIG